MSSSEQGTQKNGIDDLLEVLRAVADDVMAGDGRTSETIDDPDHGLDISELRRWIATQHTEIEILRAALCARAVDGEDPEYITKGFETLRRIESFLDEMRDEMRSLTHPTSADPSPAGTERN